MVHRNSAVIGFYGCVNGLLWFGVRPALSPDIPGHSPDHAGSRPHRSRMSRAPVARPRTLSMTERT
jgi:hypothetical protein